MQFVVNFHFFVFFRIFLSFDNIFVFGVGFFIVYIDLIIEKKPTTTRNADFWYGDSLWIVDERAFIENSRKLKP